jgi:sugar phosphate isomerase/epimerase
MNIGIRLHDTKGTTLEEHLQSAKAQGFTCVHLALQKTIPGFSMNDAPSLLTDDLAREVRGLLEKYDLKAEECIFFDDLADNVETALRLGMQSVRIRSKEQLLAELDRLLEAAL